MKHAGTSMVRPENTSCSASNLPDVRASLANEISELPDVIEVGDAIVLIERARTLVECTAMDRPEQRRLALSFLDAMLRKLAAQ